MVVTWKELVAAIEKNPDLKNMPTEPPVLDEREQREKAEMESLFNFIGMYVVVFQDLESKLDQIIQLAIGLDRRHVSDGVIELLPV
ncbi:hypothetical protein [Bradyrhizobium sp. 192]|uniref:hypothetical protein n=1 Tax=Bradyrhizobium sp. 192 TaxID=2782660 RepID=UPI001FFF6DFA|nr:hypothetical protein [Bradyrhizobium sp. 192]UPJ59479.1 hypothetical protein IVB24_06615 [Bradyrhizobium sp. 192]